MTIASPPRYTSSEHASSTWQARLPGIVGVAYVVTWVVGLTVWPVNLALNATAAQVAASHRAHPAAASVQYLLIEGLAALLFGTVLAYLLRTNRDRVSGHIVGPAVLSAVAVLTSLAQCVIGLLVTAAATGGHGASSGPLFEALNRLDGVKMLALAAAATWLAATRPVIPRWLRGVTVLLALSLIASGYAYLTLSNALGWTAFVSGPLLLAWVASAGIAVTVAARRRHRTALGPDTRIA
ncbi:MAG TPA: hypothetical protein VN714_18090 [Trebonia sp.]|nr:hypothetical protein [Trebonia sp.]